MELQSLERLPVASERGSEIRFLFAFGQGRSARARLVLPARAGEVN
jgi:hypothetical protein